MTGQLAPSLLPEVGIVVADVSSTRDLRGHPGITFNSLLCLNVKTNSKLLTFGSSTALLQGRRRPRPQKTSMNDEQRYLAQVARAITTTNTKPKTNNPRNATITKPLRSRTVRQWPLAANGYVPRHHRLEVNPLRRPLER